MCSVSYKQASIKEEKTEVKRNRICPLLSIAKRRLTNCMRELCEFYNSNDMICSIIGLNGVLIEITRTLDGIREDINELSKVVYYR